MSKTQLLQENCCFRIGTSQKCRIVNHRTRTERHLCTSSKRLFSKFPTSIRPFCMGVPVGYTAQMPEIHALVECQIIPVFLQNIASFSSDIKKYILTSPWLVLTISSCFISQQAAIPYAKVGIPKFRTFSSVKIVFSNFKSCQGLFEQWYLMKGKQPVLRMW